MLAMVMVTAMAMAMERKMLAEEMLGTLRSDS